MKVFAIGDLHLSGNPPKKPMDVFGDHWANHWERIQHSWQTQVQSDDVVFLVGDMSWAQKLSDAYEDLAAIAAMPGHKIMIRGNHDYWWASANKMRQLMGDSITFLQGHGQAITADIDGTPTVLCFGGTRGYVCPGDPSFVEETDRSIYERELLRTEAALQEMVAAGEVLDPDGTKPHKRILLLHYPPFNDKNEPSGFTALLEKYQVQLCLFGHLHDMASFARIPSTVGQTKLQLVSADFAQFDLVPIHI